MDIRDQLNQSGRGSSRAVPIISGLRSALVVAEVAISMVLLIGAGLLIRSFARLQAVEPGFRPDHILMADVPISLTVYAKPEQQVAFFDRLLGTHPRATRRESRERCLYPARFRSRMVIHFNIQGRAPKTPHDYILAGYRVVGPDISRRSEFHCWRAARSSSAIRLRRRPW